MFNITVLDPIISRVRTDVSATKRNGKMFWTKEPITEENLTQHLNDGPSRGVCPIKAGESTTMVGLLDLDSHKGESSWEEMTEVAKAICAELKRRGINPIVWRSSGGRGIHIFILWATPQDAYSVREFLKDAIGALGYKDGTDGVVKKKIEVFPKQDSVPLDGYGNQFILPLAGQSIPLRPSDLAPMDREYAIHMDWPVSPPVPVREKPLLPAHVKTDSADLDTLKVLLEHISPDTGYDPWVTVGMAIYYETNGSEEGLALWDEWSQQGKNYPGYDHLKYKWGTFRSDMVRPVTIGTLIYRARQSGWKDDTPILNPADHSDIARKIVDAEYRTGNGDVSLLRTQGQWFVHRDGCYQEREEESVRATTRRYLDRALKIDAKGAVKPFHPTMAHINAVNDALRTEALVEGLSPPAWLNGDDKGDPRDYISMQNGLFHIPTRTLLPHTPDYFTLNALPFPYESEGQPVEWLKFLHSVWGDDQESKDMIQEMFGYLATADNSLQKIFLIIGPKRSGKGTIGRIFKELLGSSNVCGPTLHSLANNFGMQPLINKLAAVVPDARISGGQVNKPAIVEKLLMISGGDNISIPRKHLEDWTGILPTRIVMMTNETPQLGDNSGALSSRFIVLKMHKSFYGQEDTGLEARLLRELPQIFRWGLDGLERLRERGRFIQPQSAASVVEQLEELNSPLLAFIDEHCEIGVGYRVSKNQIFALYQTWSSQQGRSYPSTLSVFSRDLQNACPTVNAVRAGTGAGREQVFSGIRVKQLHPRQPSHDDKVVVFLSQMRQMNQIRQARQGLFSLHT